MTSLLQGKFLVKAARLYLKAKLLNPRGHIDIEWPKWCLEKRGCFVSLHTHPACQLRGCVGFPEPLFPLKDALLESAFSAAFRDSRFHPVEESELKKLVVEVSVLTKPKRILARDAKQLLAAVKIGRDGLIARYKSFSGLLLPQVPAEWGWGVPEFLSETCGKAGLPHDFWVTNFDSVHFFRFEAKVFQEKEPDGDVVQLHGERH